MAVAVASQDGFAPADACAPAASVVIVDFQPSCRPLSRASSLGDEDGGSTRAGSSPAASPDATPERRAQESPEGPRLRTEQPERGELVSALARAVSHLASLGNRPHKLTVFHSSSAPPLGVKGYILRLATHTRCTDECLVLAAVYIDRIIREHPDFVVSMRNVHRLLATALTVAIKFHDDAMYSNKHYARCSGLNLRELNKLEAHFLCLSGWRMKVSSSEYQKYLQYALSFGQGE